jgi:hypothetical protein
VKEEHEIRSENLEKKEIRVIRKDGLIFIFFLLLSFIFWYLNSLSKEIESGIRFPVKYINIPKERLLVGKTSDQLNLYIKGPGYLILKLKLTGARAPLEIDISKVSYKRISGSNGMNYFMITSGLAKNFSVQLRSGCEIISIKPDTLFFTLEKTTGNPADYSEELKVFSKREQE